MDSAIQILVVDGVLIMPNPGGWARHFVGNEGAAIDSRLRLDRTDDCSGPGIDRRDHSDRESRRRKAEG